MFFLWDSVFFPTRTRQVTATTTTNPPTVTPPCLDGSRWWTCQEHDDNDNDKFKRRYQWLTTMAPNDDKTAAAAGGVQVCSFSYLCCMFSFFINDYPSTYRHHHHQDRPMPTFRPFRPQVRRPPIITTQCHHLVLSWARDNRVNCRLWVKFSFLFLIFLITNWRFFSLSKPNAQRRGLSATV